MDHRSQLQPGAVLSFPAMECTIEKFIGCGSNAMVYLGSYSDSQMPDLRHQVLIKELFPYTEENTIFRDEEGKIICLPEARAAAELHRLSFIRGNEVHIALQTRHPGEIDANVNTYSLNHTLYTILGYTGGRSLKEALSSQIGGDRPLLGHVRRMKAVLDVLEAFHSSGYLHLDISPDNILLIGEGRRERVTLIDYNSVHTLEEIRSGTAVYYSAKEGYTAPEVRKGQVKQIGFPADLYGAAAVFWFSMTGKRLSPLQTLRAGAPDLSGISCLSGMPDTVAGMVRHILGKGLASVPARRYQTAAEMGRDLEELEDRIEGKGITHWALWEAGRRNVAQAVRQNPALDYIREEDSLYPLQGKAEDGRIFTLPQLGEYIAGPEGRSLFLTGGGGMGKTTALLRIAYLRRESYTAGTPAFTYISLYGWNNSGDSYITGRILEHLRFRPETDTMEAARHELLALLSAPLRTRTGDRPKLVILLDGLNEAAGELSPLLEELRRLSALEGVRFLMTGRSETVQTGFYRVALEPLPEEEVRRIAAAEGLLLPEKGDLTELLRTPMMLSIFIRTAAAQNRQLLIDTREQLLERYFAALLDKASGGLPPDAGERWQLEGAVLYLLPEIACLEEAAGQALTPQKLFPLIEKCYKRMKPGYIHFLFPRWIGHIGDILGNTEGADSWYGLMVEGILWRRMGLLVMDSQGRYQVAHQLIRDYCCGLAREKGRLLRKRQRRRGLLLFLAAAVFSAAFFRWIYRPYIRPAIEAAMAAPYDESYAEAVLDAASSAYLRGARQFENMSDLLDILSEAQTDSTAWSYSLETCLEGLEDDLRFSESLPLGYIEPLLASGDVMPWSGRALDQEGYAALVALAKERSECYQSCVRMLDRLRQDEPLYEAFGDSYVEALREGIRADAAVLGYYYNLILAPELDAMEDSGAERLKDMWRRIRSNISAFGRQYEITVSVAEGMEYYRLSDYETEQRDCWDRFYANGALSKLAEPESGGMNTE